MDKLTLIAHAFIQPSLLAKINKADWPIMLEVLRSNNVIARYAWQLTQQNKCSLLPDNIQKHFISATTASNRQTQQARHECKQLNKQLNEIGVRPVFLKGAAYTLANPAVGIGRRYTDIDILVNKQELDACAQHLLNYGWMQKPLDDYDERYYREWAHEIPPLYNRMSGTTIDIHHNIIPPISGKAPNIADFLKVEKTKSFSVPSLHSQILHSAVHLFNNEEFPNGFRDLTDLYILFNQLNHIEDWQALVNHSSTVAFNNELFQAINACQRILQLKVPADIVRQLTQKQTIRSLALNNFIFDRVLMPFHSKLSPFGTKLAILLAFLRGHLKKMPLPILSKHIFHKLTREIQTLIFGKHSFK